MSDGTKCKLRDRREPGHLWMDNEIYDVFGEALGQNGISVYSAMCRYCYGTEVRLSLREIAAVARMGKDTVARSMKVLVAEGLVIETKGAKAKTVSSWALANVKALVQERIKQGVGGRGKGVEGDSSTVSQRDRWIAPQTELPSTPARENTLAEVFERKAANCLTVRQSVADAVSVGKKICVAADATDLSQIEGGFETDLSHQEEPLIDKTQDTKHKTSTNPPTPFFKGGETSFGGTADEVREIAETQALPGLIEWRIKLHRILAPLKGDLYQTDLNLGTHGRRGLRAGAQDWKDCFESLALMDYREDGGHATLLLETDDKNATRAGLTKYANRLRKHRQAVVNHEVYFELRQRASSP